MNFRTWSRNVLAALGAAALVGIVAAPAVAQQTGTVQGVVTTSDGRPLAGAEVFLAGRGITAVAAAGRIRADTDAEGQYTLDNLPAGETEIRARLVGYSQVLAQIVVIAGQTTDLNFELNRSVISLDEIVVSGAGGQVQKKQLGNTIATVDMSQLEIAPVTDFGSLIGAREPSVVGLASGGLAGQGNRIRIRGINSLSMSNEPVIYVDGVRVDNAGNFAGDVFTNGGAPSRLDDINPESIERIEILKGAAAATLYGSEASSGVIQIFTKKGSTGAPRFNFRIDQGITNFPGDRIKPLAGFARTQAQADKLNALYGNQFHDGNRSIAPYEVFESDIIRDLWETGRDQIYSASVTGGGESVQYYLSGRASFTDGPWGDGGVFEERLGPNKDFNRRYQGNFSITLFPRSRLQFRASGMFADVRQDTPQNGNDIYGPVGMAWWAKPEVANCDNSSVDTSARLGEGSPFFCTGAGNPHGAATFGTIREFSQTETGEDTEHFQGGLNMSYEATSSVTVEALIGYDVVNSRAAEFVPFRYNVDDFTGRRTDGFKIAGTRAHREITLDTKVRWNEWFFDEMLSSQLVVGGQGFIAKDVAGGGTGITFPGPGLEITEAAASQSLNEFREEKVNAGVFAQEQIGYKDVAFLTVGGRLDRNSAFGEAEDAAFYPKAGLSLIPSDLSSWASSTISTLRFRAALGKSGLQPGAFDKLTTYQPGPTVEGPGLRPDNLGNENLKPEKTTEWELGTEIGLFNNVASLDVTYWKRTTNDALIRRIFAVSGGFRNTQLDNVGQLDAKGYEFKIDWLALDRENLSLSVFANGAFIDEVITSLGGAPPFKVAGTYPRPRNFVQEGFAPGSFFGGKLIDFTPGSTVPYDSNKDGQPDTEAEFRAFLTGNASISLSNSAMDPLLRDDDGDGDLLDSFLGKPGADWQGSFGTQMTLWNNVQMNTLFEYMTGNFVVQNLTDQFRRANPAIGRNVRATAEVESLLLNPATQADEQARFDAAMEWATELKSLAPLSGLNAVSAGDWLRWRELGITYTVPASFAERLGLTNLQINATGRNLKLWSKYDGTDPEVNARGACGGGGSASTRCILSNSLDSMGLPLARRFALSLRFGF